VNGGGNGEGGLVAQCRLEGNSRIAENSCWTGFHHANPVLSNYPPS